THHAIHQVAAQLLDSVQNNTLIDANASLAELEALSQIMLDELRQLRHDDVAPESEWTHSGLSER
ncbi:MAG: hypothetical protein PHU77_05640, partial [Simplicispira sp.]|nr:hypothetical protein [Simplicispira sp.]